MSSISVLIKICSSGIMRYPEISEKVFIINAGWLITTLWTTIKPFIPSRTEEKLTILGTNYHQTLCESLFGTSDLAATDGMVQLQCILSSTSSPTFPSSNQIHDVESAYDLILSEIFSTNANTEIYPDTKEFLESALRFVEKSPSCRFSSYRSRIVQYLANVTPVSKS